MAWVVAYPAVRVRTKAGEAYEPLHAELFDVKRFDVKWFDPVLVAAAEAGPDALRQLARREHPLAEVFSFPFLSPAWAEMLLSEAEHYAASGLINPKPNGMNNYGLLWNHIGMEPMFDLIVARFIAPLAAAVVARAEFGCCSPQHRGPARLPCGSG